VLQRYTQKPYNDVHSTKILDSDLGYSSVFAEARWVPRSIIARVTSGEGKETKKAIGSTNHRLPIVN
jgi:hypothetical protein